MLRFRNICFKSKRNRSNTILLYTCRGRIYFRQKLATHFYDVLYIQYIFSIYIYRGVKLYLSMSPLQCKQVSQLAIYLNETLIALYIVPRYRKVGTSRIRPIYVIVAIQPIS